MKDTLTGRVLIVDDDVELVDMLKAYLEAEGFRVEAVQGTAAVGRAISGDFDIVLLDIMMPRVSGLEILRCIHAQSVIPVLMLTARGEGADRVRGLELGADDYVPKPCTPRELAARIRAILRRTRTPAAKPSADAILVGPLSVWPDRRQVEWAGKPIDLTARSSVCSRYWRGMWVARSARKCSPPRRWVARSGPSIVGRGSLIETVHGIGYELIGS